MKRNIIVIILFALTQLNSFLVSKGYQPLPTVSEGDVAWLATFIVSVIAMVRENPFKKKKKPSEEKPSDK